MRRFIKLVSDTTLSIVLASIEAKNKKKSMKDMTADELHEYALSIAREQIKQDTELKKLARRDH
jgi:hypothetical protein